MVLSRMAKSGDRLIGVTVTLGSKGTFTDLDGEYELELPAGEQEVSIQLCGLRIKRVIAVTVVADQRTHRAER